MKCTILYHHNWTMWCHRPALHIWCTWWAPCRRQQSLGFGQDLRKFCVWFKDCWWKMCVGDSQASATSNIICFSSDSSMILYNDDVDDDDNVDDVDDVHLHPVQFHRLHRQSSRRIPQTQSPPADLFVIQCFHFLTFLSRCIWSHIYIIMQPHFHFIFSHHNFHPCACIIKVNWDRLRVRLQLRSDVEVHLMWENV